jgi:hypothetical protein
MLPHQSAEKDNEPLVSDECHHVVAMGGFDHDNDWLEFDEGSIGDSEEIPKNDEDNNNDADDVYADEDNVEDVLHVPFTQHGEIDLTSDVDNPLIDTYRGSIQQARDTMCGQWRECTWDKKNLDIQAPATNEEVITSPTLF